MALDAAPVDLQVARVDRIVKAHVDAVPLDPLLSDPAPEQVVRMGGAQLVEHRLGVLARVTRARGQNGFGRRLVEPVQVPTCLRSA